MKPLVLIAASVAALAPIQAYAQPPRKLPQHVTPWTPMPAPSGPLSAAPGLAPKPIPPLSATYWSDIGPAPLAETGNASAPFSGRITGIAADPFFANLIYVAAAGDGVWATFDGGTHWAHLTDPQKTLSMGAITIGTIDEDLDGNRDPFDRRIIYAGTGEANNSGDSNFGRGILISTNLGLTWTLSTGPSNVFDRLTTSQIAVDPANGRVAYAAMADFGVNGLCCANTGIWKTSNGGTTWTNTTASIDSVSPWSAVVIDPNHPLTLYSAVGDPFGAATNGVYKSTNGGSTWSLLSNGPKGVAAGRIAIAVSKSNSQVVYVTASGTGPGNGSTTFGSLYKIMRSGNGGTTFTDLTAGTPNYLGFQGFYDTTVSVDPSNSAVVYVAGQFATNSILRSIDSGAHWSDISSGGSSPHADHHADVFDANGKLLDGDDGGIYRLDNPTAPSWTDLNGNLETIQFDGIGLHPTDRNKAIGGSQDNGTEVFAGSQVWTETDGGDGGLPSLAKPTAT